MKTLQLLSVVCALSVAAVAGPITWTVNVALSDGGTATGTFVFDADAGTACSTANTPCGAYSDVNVVTTTGTVLSGTTYNTVCGLGGDTACAGESPDSTEVMFLTSGAADQTGDQAIGFFFLAAGPVPPAGLSDAGGVFDVSNTVAGAVQESFCNDAACDAPTGVSRVSVAGTVSATPEPSTALLLTAPLALLGLALFSKRRRQA